MTDFQEQVISLISAALQGGVSEWTDGTDIEALYAIAKNHQMIPLIYEGLAQIPGALSPEWEKRFFSDTCRLAAFSEKQRAVLGKLCTALDEEKLRYMLLKGSILKRFYPKPEMRLMSDMDILIDQKEYPKIEKLMQEMGFAADEETDHELKWRAEQGIYIELHKRLIPSYNKDYYAYFGDGWNEAIEGKHGMEMPPERMFIYLFVHFAKHYRDSGVGIKYVVDFYVLKKAYPNLGWKYIRAELETLRLLEFFNNIMRLIGVWFEGEKSDEITDYLTEKIFSFGTYGFYDHTVLAEGLKLSKGHRFAWFYKCRTLIFPPRRALCEIYPILKKHGWVLPVMWVVHWFDVLLFRRDRIRLQKERLDGTAAEKVRAYQKELNYVGLDLHFE